MIDAEILARALEAKADALRSLLQAKVDANLSGDVLQARSGRLKAAAFVDLDADDDGFVLAAGADDVPYAAIQEYGGHTAAHDIVPVKAGALRFAGAAGPEFARRVRHPGSTLPARAPFGAALDALRADAAADLKAAIRDALDAH